MKDNEYIEIEGTEYCWEGLLDNAIMGLSETKFSWTKNMIKNNLSQLRTKYFQGQKAIKVLKELDDWIYSDTYNPLSIKSKIKELMEN